MHDWDISLTAVLASVGWTLGVLLALVDLIVGHDVGSLGVVFVAGAATLNVRRFFCRLNEREQNAFEMGRDYQSGVRSVP